MNYIRILRGLRAFAVVSILSSHQQGRLTKKINREGREGREEIDALSTESFAQRREWNREVSALRTGMEVLSEWPVDLPADRVKLVNQPRTAAEREATPISIKPNRPQSAHFPVSFPSFRL